MCDPEEPKSSELAGMDEELISSGWGRFKLGTQRSLNPRSFSAPWLSHLGFLTRIVFFALLFILSIIILSHVFQIRRQLQHESVQGKPNKISDLGVKEHTEALQLIEKLNKTLELGIKEQVEASQFVELLNKTLSALCRPCPCDWKFYKDRCYFISVSQKSWDIAKEACEADDSYLAIINSSEEQKYLMQYADSRHRLWLGLSDKTKEGTWHWEDGTTLNQSFWNEGEPNNSGDEDCCELISQGWNDAPCSKENSWVCEKEAFPCPTL